MADPIEPQHESQSPEPEPEPQPQPQPDSEPESRPGVPMEARPEPTGGRWRSPPPQTRAGEKLTRAALDEPTPVYGSAQPPRGLSGALRRVAYGIPEHRKRHWLLLMFADRVDVLEDRLRSPLGAAVAAGALAAVVLVAVTRD